MSNSANRAYLEDLAYIHNAGFGSVAENAARELLAALKANRPPASQDGLVIDVGCGGGILAERLVAAGYRVLGFDLSEAMIALARTRVPAGEFRWESFVTAALPKCSAVTAIGEVFNYLFDGKNTRSRLANVFGRVYAALEPGGLFLFDIAEPGRTGPTRRRRNFSEGADWACLFSAAENEARTTLTRQITSFRKIGSGYRRTGEIHRLRLYKRSAVKARLRGIGFRVRTLRAYSDFRFAPGWVGLLATKPK
jgi:SAM-dependent methyltransferase